MKNLLSLLLFLLCFLVESFSQDSANVVHLTRLPPEGIILDKEWKFHAGDNPEWAKLDLDDKNWVSINATDDIDKLDVLKKAEIGWFRLHIKIDSSLLNKPVVFTVKQIGASEIYLNGAMIFRFGVVSHDHDKEVLFNPNYKPYIFQFKGSLSQVIAVRYSFTKSNLYFKNQGFGNPTLVLRILPAQAAFNIIEKEKSYNSAITFAEVGFLFLLFLLHFFFYLSYPKNKTNLYYSLFALCLMMFYWLWFLSYNLPREGHSFFILSLLSLVIGIPGLFLALTAVYSHCRETRDWRYWLILFCMLLIFPTAWWPYDWGWLTCYVYALLIILDALRVSLKGLKKNILGSRIIFIGWVAFLVSFGFSILITYGIIKPSALGQHYKYIEDLTYNAGFLFLWIPFSIILALEFAKTNKSLTQQLQEVKRLSQKTIEQEKEKQQILSMQNETLEQQVQQRTSQLQQSLENLKLTQTQLIQSEKMASLGELTAGIAHEIQNPLNFVNNFSEVNKELLIEMKDEIDKGNLGEVKSIANDLIDNQEKINFHGKRADSIVKGMMQHSKTNTGQKEPTDINALADECLRLSYHGFRAKDKSFSATIETDFDNSIAKINIVPQDLGRVLLNLFNNAFYAVLEKQKTGNKNYKPLVTVATKSPSFLGKGSVEVIVTDNGNGIPQKVIDKIFQPFFTTKPTGQGTGLGLSLSYDIIKALGGELRVETKEGEGAEFVIHLPWGYK
jgi:signal transduction histidine kinase